MTRDDGRRPGDRSSETDDEPIGAPVLPPWVGEARERAAARVEGLLRTPGARGAAVAFLVMVGVRMIIALPVAWGLLRPEVAGVTIDVRWLVAMATSLLLALTLHLATAPHLLPGTPAARSRLVTGVLSALYLTALGTLAAGSFGPWATAAIPLLVQVALVVAFVPPRGGDSPAGPTPDRRRQMILAVVYAAVGVLVAAALVQALPYIGGGSPWLILDGVEYALVATMAVLAWGVNRAAGAGGALFVVAEVLTTLQIMLFAQPLPLFAPLLAPAWSAPYPALITWCYVLALGLIAAGVLRRVFGTA
ncbi:hypothetical protein [Myceligenerans halotolerans]